MMKVNEENWIRPGDHRFGDETETRKFGLKMDYLNKKTVKYLSENLPEHQFLVNPVNKSGVYAVVDRIKCTKDKPEIANFSFYRSGILQKGQSMVAEVGVPSEPGYEPKVYLAIDDDIRDYTRDDIKILANSFAGKIQAEIDALNAE